MNADRIKGLFARRSAAGYRAAGFLMLAGSSVSASVWGCAEYISSRESEEIYVAVQALEVSPPSLHNGALGYYCSATYSTHGWTFSWGSNYQTNQCAGLTGATRMKSGAYLINGTNYVEAWCDTNAGHTTYTRTAYSGTGSTPLSQAYTWAANLSGSYGDCVFRVSVGGQRTDSPGSETPPSGTAIPAPSADPSFTFDYDVFRNFITTKMMGTAQDPVGYQFAVYAPNGALVSGTDSPYEAGDAQLLVPPVPMEATRRMDMASLSKTLTAMATVAAIQDIRDGILSNGSGRNHFGSNWEDNISLDSHIVDYLPSDWSPASWVNSVTFRSLLNHTSGLCSSASQGPYLDDYASLKAALAQGAQGTAGEYDYCNPGYALLRILIPYLVDGPAGYDWLRNQLALDDAGVSAVDEEMGDYTAASYRNYVRGRVLSRVGLSGIDAYWNGPSDPLTNLYGWQDGGVMVACNDVNAWGSGCIPGLSEVSNTRVRNAGSGSWFLSTPEYAKLLSSYWNDQIIFNAPTVNVGSMLGLESAGELNRRGLGYDARRLTYGASPATYKYYFTKNGSGAAISVWVTFFNKYSAVLSTNTTPFPPMGWSAETLVGRAFMKATIPNAWTCLDSKYCDNNCDTTCGAFDLDCAYSNAF